jgi:hypothetical protein
LAIVSGRVIDGIKLHADLVQAGNTLPAQPVLHDPDRQPTLAVARAWRAWYESLFNEPPGADSWSPDRMEYGFALSSSSSSQWRASTMAAPRTGGSVRPLSGPADPARRLTPLLPHHAPRWLRP